MMLEIMGNDVRTAHDGLEGIAAASAYRPDLIVLDIGMPGLNGFEVCRRIREQPWGRGIVIVALTGWGQDDDRRQSQRGGLRSPPRQAGRARRPRGTARERRRAESRVTAAPASRRARSCAAGRAASSTAATGNPGRREAGDRGVAPTAPRSLTAAARRPECDRSDRRAPARMQPSRRSMQLDDER